MTIPVALAGVSGILSVSGISRKRCKTSPSSSLTRCHSCQERLWHSVTFSSKTKSVSSKTKPLCQGLSCQAKMTERLYRAAPALFRSLERRPLSNLSDACGASSPSRGAFGIPQGLLLSPEALKSVCGESVNYSSSRRFLMTINTAPAATKVSRAM